MTTIICYVAVIAPSRLVNEAVTWCVYRAVSHDHLTDTISRMLCVQQKASISSSAKTRINTLIVPRLSRVAITRTGAGISRTSRFSLLTVFAGQGRGEEVVAFLPEDGSNRTSMLLEHLQLAATQNTDYSLFDASSKLASMHTA